LKTGGFRVGVHITDVSSFVEIKSELDKEARERGTTLLLSSFSGSSNSYGIENIPSPSLFCRNDFETLNKFRMSSDSPPTKKLNEWKKAYPLIADMILKIQGFPTGTKRESEMKLRYNDIVFVQRWLWMNVIEHIKNGEEEKAAALLCKEELHPFHAMALHDWISIQSFAEYIILLMSWQISGIESAL
jgi:hypothetical protein